MSEPVQKSSPAPARPVIQSEGMEEAIIRGGKDLVNQLHILLKTAQIHESGNVAMEGPVGQVMALLKDLWRWVDEVHLVREEDYFSLGDLKLKMDMEGFVSYTSVVDTLKRLEIGGISFPPSCTDKDLKILIYAIVQTDLNAPDPFTLVTGKLKAAGFDHIEIEKYEEKRERVDELIQDRKAMAKSTYFKTMTAVTEVMNNVKLGQAINVKRSKRVVQGMVDMLLDDESTLLGLTTLRNHDEYTHNHSVNVCILALTMGQRLGYSKKRLTELGISALFHDMGKARISNDILNKPTEFTVEEWRIMREHPALGVKDIIKLKGINEMTARMASGIFEHHMNYDRSGYPKIEGPWDVTVMGRIVGIVDCYDALTSSRVYNRVPYSPEKALKFMLNKSGRAFDPILLKIFVNSIGIFPIGTLVLLDNNQLGVVVEANPHPEKGQRPKVKVIMDMMGREQEDEVVDLAETDETTGDYRYNIIKIVDAKKYNIDVGRYFL